MREGGAGGDHRSHGSRGSVRDSYELGGYDNLYHTIYLSHQ